MLTEVRWGTVGMQTPSHSVFFHARTSTASGKVDSDRSKCCRVVTMTWTLQFFFCSLVADTLHYSGSSTSVHSSPSCSHTVHCKQVVLKRGPRGVQHRTQGCFAAITDPTHEPYRCSRGREADTSPTGVVRSRRQTAWTRDVVFVTTDLRTADVEGGRRC